MGKRFGRNQKRKLQERIDALEWEARMDLSHEAVHIMRQTCERGLGMNCTFVDDEMMLLVGLAQRAVLAGLATDAQPDTLRRMTEAAEPHRAAHEKQLGRPLIGN